EIVYEIISVEDEETSDLIINFPKTYDFISNCLTKRNCDDNKCYNILVHCNAGVSRSAAVIIAYIMKINNLNYVEAFDFVKSKYSKASPNLGFLAQLELYHLMNFEIDVNKKEYRRWMLTRMARDFSDYGCVSNLTLSVDPKNFIKDAKLKLLRCPKCRRILATMDNVINHEPGKGQVDFSYFKRDWMELIKQNENTTSSNRSCSQYFIEPMEWIKGLQEGNLEGKIYCPCCEFKLGSFSWAGQTCSCGNWITPAFSLQKSKVDLV
ncbi:dual specificity phosphatase 12, partial [Clydaea vesicula]